MEAHPLFTHLRHNLLQKLTQPVQLVPTKKFHTKSSSLCRCATQDTGVGVAHMPLEGPRNKAWIVSP